MTIGKYLKDQISNCSPKLLLGIKKDKVSDSKNQTPGIGNVPVIGNLFKGKAKSDSLNELLVFIAPRIL